MRRFDSLPELLVANRRAVIVLGLVITVFLGSGIPAVELRTSHEEFVGGTTSSATLDYVETNFRTGPENTTTALVMIKRTYHVLGPRDIAEQLRYEQRLLADDRVAATLAEDHPPTGIANVIAFVKIQRSGGLDGGGAEDAGGSNGEIDPLPEPRPSIEKQLRPFERAEWKNLPRIEQIAIRELNEDPAGPPGGVYAFVPKYYDHKFDRRAEATVIYVYQRENLSHEQLLRSQTAMRELAREEINESPGKQVWVYGEGIVNDELARSTIDSLLLVGPLGLLFVVSVLLYAYRDPFDVLLALLGVVVMLVWTFGFMGWVGIEFNQLFVSIPVFLMGLAIDYAIHSFMRYREARGTNGPSDVHAVSVGEDPAPDIETAMQTALRGVGTAFVLVTVTTAIGFASGVVSPAEPIREFGLVAAVGIVATLAVFGGLIPAVKIELDQFLEAREHDRHERAFATGGGRLNGVLDRSIRLAERTPWTVVVVALLATSVGVVGATTIDTTFDQQAFHVKDTPDWLQKLPEPFRPGRYETYEALSFFRSRGFVNDRNTVHILVRGNVTHPATLQRIHRAQTYAQQSNATLEFGRHGLRVDDLSSGLIRVSTSPVTVIQSVAEENESFNETLTAADTDGDGVPDRNLRQVYDALYRVSPAGAKTVIHREDGQYRALRIGLYINGSKPTQEVATVMHDTAAMIDEGNAGLAATATGQPIIRATVQSNLFTTTLRSFALTLAIVVALLVLFYWWRRGSATLGLVTTLPVLFAVAWILGTMAALGIPFNVLTALIASFTIGLGVDYSIHVSERYVQELDRQNSVSDALRTSVFGTGGALLGSALTTVGGFGVLVFALLTPLRQFGIVTSLTIVYAFLGSVVVLPSLLALWTRYLAGNEFEPSHDVRGDPREFARDFEHWD